MSRSGIDDYKVRRNTLRRIEPPVPQGRAAGAGGVGGVAAALATHHPERGALQGHRGRRHFTPRHSATDAWKPGLRRLSIPGADTRDPPRGLRHVDAPRPENKDRPEGKHFPDKTNVRSKGGGYMNLQPRRIVRNADGEPCCERPAD